MPATIRLILHVTSSNNGVHHPPSATDMAGPAVAIAWPEPTNERAVYELFQSRTPLYIYRSLYARHKHDLDAVDRQWRVIAMLKAAADRTRVPAGPGILESDGTLAGKYKKLVEYVVELEAHKKQLVAENEILRERCERFKNEAIASKFTLDSICKMMSSARVCLSGSNSKP